MGTSAGAVDLSTGRRVVLGREGCPVEADLHRADLASGAVPGVYQPVRASGRTLVDGAVHSSTNLDLAGAVAATGAEVVVVEASGPEARLHGPNTLRTDGGAEIARAAYDATARQLEAAARRRRVA